MRAAIVHHLALGFVGSVLACGASFAGESPHAAATAQSADGIALLITATQALTGHPGVLLAEGPPNGTLHRTVAVAEVSASEIMAAELRDTAGAFTSPLSVGTLQAIDVLVLAESVGSGFGDGNGDVALTESWTTRLAWGYFTDLLGERVATNWAEIEHVVDWWTVDASGSTVNCVILPLGAGGAGEMHLAFYERAAALGLVDLAGADGGVGPGGIGGGTVSGPSGLPLPQPPVPLLTCLSLGWQGNANGAGGFVQCCAFYVTLGGAIAACDSEFNSDALLCLGGGAALAGTCFVKCMGLVSGSVVLPFVGQLTTGGCAAICGISGVVTILGCLMIADMEWDQCRLAACTAYTTALVANGCFPPPSAALGGPCGAIVPGWGSPLAPGGGAPGGGHHESGGGEPGDGQPHR